MAYPERMVRSQHTFDTARNLSFGGPPVQRVSLPILEYGPELGIDVERLPNGAYVWDALEASS